MAQGELSEALMFGLAAGLVAALLRTWGGTIRGFPAFAAWWAAQKRKKPLGCHTCMGTWCGLAVLFLVRLGGKAFVFASSVDAGVFLLAVCAVAAWLNAQLVPAHVPSSAELDELFAEPDKEKTP